MEFASLSNKTAGQAAPAKVEKSKPAFDAINDILGYDVRETLAIQRDEAFRSKVEERIDSAGESMPAKDILGPLDKD